LCPSGQSLLAQRFVARQGGGGGNFKN
jgi:hypothetical protein